MLPQVAMPVQELEIVRSIGAPLRFGDDMIDVPLVAVPEEQSAPSTFALKSAKNSKVISLRGSVDPLLESEQVLLQGEPGQVVPAIIYWHGLDSFGRLYHPDNRAHVSISLDFLQGIGFLGNPSLVRPVVGTYSRGRGEHARGYFVPQPRFVPDVGSDYPPDESLGCTVGRTSHPTPAHRAHFGPSLLTRVGLFSMTTAKSVRVPTPIRSC